LIPSLGKGSYFPPGFFLCGGTINRLKILRHLLAFFPANIVQAGPHQMHDAQLHLRLGSVVFEIASPDLTTNGDRSAERATGATSLLRRRPPAKSVSALKVHRI
jgi:hypothetical protein